MAPDKLNLYALDWSAQRTIRVYSRAPESGALTLIQSLQAALAASPESMGPRTSRSHPTANTST